MLRRRHDPEIMDDLSIQDERMDNALRELKRVNKFLGGRATTQKGLQVLQEKLGLDRPLSLLDVGAGGADVFEGSARNLNITVVDRNRRVCEFVKEQMSYAVICGDALHLPFQEKSFDIIHASLFLHHLDEEKIRHVVSSCLRVSRFGIIINDLRRSIFAYAGIRILTAIFSKSPMVKHDGPLSVLRGFSRNELRSILADCGITRYSLQRTWAFRWLVVIVH